MGVSVGPVGAGVTVGQSRDYDRDRERATAIKEREPAERTTVIRKEHEDGTRDARLSPTAAQKRTLREVGKGPKTGLLRTAAIEANGHSARKPHTLTKRKAPLHATQLLRQLSARLGDLEWLDGRFSAGDLMMLRASGILDQFNNLAAYVARGEARPAYKRAFAAQLAINAP